MHDDDRRDRPIKIDMTVTVHVPALAGINAQLAEILTKLEQSARREETTMATVQDARDRVRAQATVIESIKALVQLLKDNADDPEALAALVNDLDANSVALDTIANTPQAGLKA